MSTLPVRAGRRCHNAINPLHSTVYFSPDLGKELGELGIDDSNAAYFAVRGAALGAVGPGTVTAAFYNFNHDLVARHLPAVWSIASPQAVLEARLRAADATLRRLLGEETIASPNWPRRPDWPCAPPRHVPDTPGRSTPPTPICRCPRRRTWRTGTPGRCCANTAATPTSRPCSPAGLDPVEALVSHTATGKGMNPRWVLATRGWRRTDWEAASERLRGRGLLDDEGELTEAGIALRADLEDATDRMDLAPYEHLGEEGVERLTELARGFLFTAASAGAFPADLVGKG